MPKNIRYDFVTLLCTQGGKDHASGRYIFTCLSPITRFLFPKDDDILLEYLKEDGQSIEPIWYSNKPAITLFNCLLLQTSVITSYPFFMPSQDFDHLELVVQVLSYITYGACEWKRRNWNWLEHICSKLQSEGYCCKHMPPTQ